MFLSTLFQILVRMLGNSGASRNVLRFLIGPLCFFQDKYLLFTYNIYQNSTYNRKSDRVIKMNSTIHFFSKSMYNRKSNTVMKMNSTQWSKVLMQGHCNQNGCFWLCFRKFGLNSKILPQTDSNSPSMAQDNCQISFQKISQIRQSQSHIIVLFKPKKHAVSSLRLNKIMDLNHKKITSNQ